MPTDSLGDDATTHMNKRHLVAFGDGCAALRPDTPLECCRIAKRGASLDNRPHRPSRQFVLHVKLDTWSTNGRGTVGVPGKGSATKPAELRECPGLCRGSSGFFGNCCYAACRDSNMSRRTPQQPRSSTDRALFRTAERTTSLEFSADAAHGPRLAFSACLSFAPSRLCFAAA